MYQAAVPELTVSCPCVREGCFGYKVGAEKCLENKLEKGFNTTDVPLEFCLLVADVGEAIDAWRKDRQAVAEELADVAIFVLGLAEMTGTDLQDAVEDKLAVNRARIYRRVGDGLHVQVAGDAFSAGSSA